MTNKCRLQEALTGDRVNWKSRPCQVLTLRLLTACASGPRPRSGLRRLVSCSRRRSRPTSTECVSGGDASGPTEGGEATQTTSRGQPCSAWMCGVCLHREACVVCGAGRAPQPRGGPSRRFPAGLAEALCWQEGDRGWLLPALLPGHCSQLPDPPPPHSHELEAGACCQVGRASCKLR